ncbi:hypothetical protein ZWY2020_006333 [Hordeum vulgare]|nr:hypothetical protein ZWY2020_006333 [Hordeum vulgare]
MSFLCFLAHRVRPPTRQWALRRCLLALERVRREAASEAVGRGRRRPANAYQLEISTTSEKLIECQETILSVGKQLKALASPKDATSVRPERKPRSQSVNEMLAVDDGGFDDLRSPKTKEIICSEIRPPHERRFSADERGDDSVSYYCHPTPVVPPAKHYDVSGSCKKEAAAKAVSLAVVPSKQKGNPNLLKRILTGRRRDAIIKPKGAAHQNPDELVHEPERCEPMLKEAVAEHAAHGRQVPDEGLPQTKASIAPTKDCQAEGNADDQKENLGMQEANKDPCALKPRKNTKKTTRRRLLPRSAMMLKEFTGLDIDATDSKRATGAAQQNPDELVHELERCEPMLKEAAAEHAAHGRQAPTKDCQAEGNADDQKENLGMEEANEDLCALKPRENTKKTTSGRRLLPRSAMLILFQLHT